MNEKLNQEILAEANTKLTRYRIEDAQNWREEIDRIPFIQFPADWKVQVIPPFGDAVVRFRVELPDGTHKSIYLDARCSLGYWPTTSAAKQSPYWEVYPYRGDCGRCSMDEIDRLLDMIGDTKDEE